MNETIIFNPGSEKLVLQIPSSERLIYYTGKQKDAYLHHIEQINVDSYVINTTVMNIVQIKSMIRHIHYLNSIISIILYKADFGVFEELMTQGNIHIAQTEDEIINLLNGITAVHRNSNRIQWPLKAGYRIDTNDTENEKNSDVLSISSGGCFLKTDTVPEINKGDRISIVFHFKDFDFYSDGTVVRISKGDKDSTIGMALKFSEVSPQTEKCIQEIIDEKILWEIMHMLK